MLGRRASFWLAVAGVSLLSSFTVELVARKAPIPGLQRFVSFIHCGPSGS